MRARKEHLTVLSEAEASALYDLPEYNNEQRLEYLNLAEGELQMALARHNLSAQVYCILQLGYFKAVKMFFRITWQEADLEDVHFILQQYFQGQTLVPQIISKHEHYAQCSKIAAFFGYTSWAKTDEPLLLAHAQKLIHRDMSQQFIAMGLLDYLQVQRIIRPKYTTLQTLVSTIINKERSRLAQIIRSHLSDKDKQLLESMIAEDETLSKLAALKQDAKDFKPQMMITERKKLETLRPVHQIIKSLIPLLKLSQQNLHHYASLVNYYTIYDLREKLKREQSYLYIMCYCWKRFQQISDNLVNAFSFFFKQIEEEINELTNYKLTEHVMSQREEFIMMKRLVQLYVDDELPDEMSFGLVRKKAFDILAKEDIISKVSTMGKKPAQEDDFYWQETDNFKRKITYNLRHLVAVLNFSSTNSENRWMTALQWIKVDFPQLKGIAPLMEDCPKKTIPIKLLPYLTTKNNGQPNKVNPSRYEFWIYKQLNNQLKTGSIFLEDSLQYRSLSQDLVWPEGKENLIDELNIPALMQPIGIQLDDLFAQLDLLWVTFNKNLKRGKLKHLRYDEKYKTLHWHKNKAKKDEQIQSQFYKQMSLCDITDVLRYVNRRCGFMSAFSHIQPRYSKQPAKEASLIGTLIAQAMNNGNLNMSAISDIPYALLQETLYARIRLPTLKSANDLISNDIARMPIFPFYSFDLELLYGGVDGQKFEAETPTIKSRYSKKYFRKGKGIVAYTLLANHVPLQVELIGANEHESYFVFDIWYNNTSDISPDIITGDMHSINRANFALMHWFGARLYPRFTNIEAERIHLYSQKAKVEYEKYLIQPHGQIDRELIESEWPNLQRVIITLGLKEMTQSTLVKKLCTYKQEHRTRLALFEFDKLIRSIHTLKYLLNPSIQSNTHRSHNRIEAYHQLRSAIAQAYGKKQLTGKTDIAIEVSNQCGRLIANAIIHYNSTILSKLLEKYQAEAHQKSLGLLSKISPVAWQHIHFQGHFKFLEEHLIDLDQIIKHLKLVP
jgi:TnpA family transposase